MIDIRNGGAAVWFTVKLMRRQGVKLSVTAPTKQNTPQPAKKKCKTITALHLKNKKDGPVPVDIVQNCH